jgi:hypothetical protein
MTPLQRFVYTLAKDHHTDDVDTGVPNDVNQARRSVRGNL